MLGLLDLLLSCTAICTVSASHFFFIHIPTTSQNNLRKLAEANNEFALNIHRQLASQTAGNIFFSPLSLSTVFGMLYYGAKGDTAEELRRVLGYDKADIDEGLMHETFRQYLTECLPSTDPSSYVLNSANSILFDKRLDLDPTYKNEVQDFYQASVKDVDFITEGPQIVNEVNDWVKTKTEGKIDQLLDKLDSSAVLVLLNAVYFKGTWKTRFDPRKTMPNLFFNNGLDSEAKEVPTMRLTDRFPYTSFLNIQALELPYKGENLSMLLLLPNDRNGLESLEKTLSPKKLSAIRHQLDKTKVRLTFPKFRIQYSNEMSSDMQSLGAKSIFQSNADFSGISRSPGIFVTQVLHKAVVEVNEEGSEAAATTGVVSSRKSPIDDHIPDFVVDHPFLFAIMDKRNDMILFLGRVTNL